MTLFQYITAQIKEDIHEHGAESDLCESCVRVAKAFNEASRPDPTWESGRLSNSLEHPWKLSATEAMQIYSLVTGP